MPPESISRILSEKTNQNARTEQVIGFQAMELWVNTEQPATNDLDLSSEDLGGEGGVPFGSRLDPLL